MAQGRLKIQCFVNETYIPVDNVKITIRPSAAGPSSNVISLSTDSMGESQIIDLEAPHIVCMI